MRPAFFSLEGGFRAHGGRLARITARTAAGSALAESPCATNPKHGGRLRA